MAITQDGVIYHKDITDAMENTVGYGTGKKISDFPIATPTGGDKILFEQDGNGKSTTVEDLGKVVGINLDLLWVNTDPTDGFIAQWIPLDLGKYKLVIIILYDTINRLAMKTYISFKEENGHKIVIFTPTTLLARQVIVNDGGVTFGEGVAYRTYNSEENQDISNYYVIPYKIYGVK